MKLIVSKLKQYKANFRKFFIDDRDFLLSDVPFTPNMTHLKWKKELIDLANKHNMRVLEIGSREVCGPSEMRKQMKDAEYVGFDYYPGANVDVVGDAHKLSTYFDKKFDLIFSSAVFEHLAMPWVVAEEISKLLNVGGYVFVETHYSFSSHERPWHFFQYSEEALKALFNPAMGFECIEAGVANPIVGRFSNLADPYLRNQQVRGLYCHSEFFGKKVKDVPDFDWRKIGLSDVVGDTKYVEPVNITKKNT